MIRKIMFALVFSYFYTAVYYIILLTNTKIKPIKSSVLLSLGFLEILLGEWAPLLFILYIHNKNLISEEENIQEE